MTTEQDLQNEISSMWSAMRERGDMVADAPLNKVGMPYTAPYEGVCFPVEVDGEFCMVSIPVEQVQRFALALVALVPASKSMDAECDVEIATHEAILKAKGGR